jgi:hypothetical protein
MTLHVENRQLPRPSPERGRNILAFLQRRPNDVFVFLYLLVNIEY